MHFSFLISKFQPDRFYKISYFSSIFNVSETLMANIQLFLVLTLYSSGEQEPDGEDADI